MRKIIHLDLDAFFASVEQLDFPELRGKPVIVGGRGKRGVVSTCSYEARAYGVRSAMPMARARKLCPDGIFLPVRHERYKEKSREVRRIIAEYSQTVETVGLDEAYLDVSHYPDAVPIARELKTRVWTETGLTCSIGLSYNKSLAKIASDLKKAECLCDHSAGTGVKHIEGSADRRSARDREKVPGAAEKHGNPYRP